MLDGSRLVQDCSMDVSAQGTGLLRPCTSSSPCFGISSSETGTRGPTLPAPHRGSGHSGASRGGTAARWGSPAPCHAAAAAAGAQPSPRSHPVPWQRPRGRARNALGRQLPGPVSARLWSQVAASQCPGSSNICGGGLGTAGAFVLQRETAKNPHLSEKKKKALQENGGCCPCAREAGQGCGVAGSSRRETPWTGSFSSWQPGEMQCQPQDNLLAHPSPIPPSAASKLGLGSSGPLGSSSGVCTAFNKSR